MSRASAFSFDIFTPLSEFDPRLFGPLTQADLRLYLELKDAAGQYNRARQRILALLAAGAPVEPGPLQAAVQDHEVRRFCPSALVATLGQRRVEELRALVEPRTEHWLVVGPADGVVPQVQTPAQQPSATCTGWERAARTR